MFKQQVSKSMIMLSIFFHFTSCKARKISDTSEIKHYSKYATFADFRLNAFLDVNYPNKIPSDPSSLLKSNFKQEIDLQLEEQLNYLTGSLLNYWHFERYPAAVSGKSKVKINRVSKSPINDKAIRVHYVYEDQGAFNKELVSDRHVTVRVALPINLDGFYEKTLADDYSNTCLAVDGNTEKEKFWYYWKADNKGCKLGPNDVQFVNDALVTPRPHTKETYPWYKDFFEKEEGFNIVLLFGEGAFDKYSTPTLDNIAASGFQQVERSDFYAAFTKEVSGQKINLKVYDMVGGSSDFDDIAVQSLKNADVFIYAGHSSYGKFFDPGRLNLTSQSFDQKKRQIFYFAGCRTFRYYNAKYFEMKPENLNIVTTSVPAYFLTYPKTLTAFITSLTNGERWSWQKIIDQMQQAETTALKETKVEGMDIPYATWPKFKALISVNGDENNPKTP